MASVTLKKNEERRIKAGHLWIFSNEIHSVAESPENGDIVTVLDSSGNHIGNGFYNKNSLIAVRLLSKYYKGDLYDYFRKSLISANDIRITAYPERNSYRLCFSESDFIPGLIIDKYNDTYVLQVYSAGVEKNIGHIIKLLSDDFGASNIFTMNDMYFRKLEGLEEKDIADKMNDEIISDGKLKYNICFAKAQKTGFYFDQSDNRFTLAKFAKNRTVLDCFCNHGGFGLHCAVNSAIDVTFVDSSEIQIENAKRNSELNNVNIPVEYIVSDVFDYLEKCISSGKKYDVVNIDPPAFAKSKKSIPTALKGYEKLNTLAMKCLNQGGILATSSCSNHVDKDSFIGAVNKAASKSKKQLQQIYYNTASKDHPSIPSMPETSYLKFAIFGVI